MAQKTELGYSPSDKVGSQNVNQIQRENGGPVVRPEQVVVEF